MQQAHSEIYEQRICLGAFEDTRNLSPGINGSFCSFASSDYYRGLEVPLIGGEVADWVGSRILVGDYSAAPRTHLENGQICIKRDTASLWGT